MKLLMAISSLDAGGAETHVVSLAGALQRAGNEVTVVSSGGRLVRELNRQGVSHITVPLNSAHPALMAVAYGTLLRLVKQYSFDVLHAHARIPAFLLSGISRSKGIPLVVTAHARFSKEFPKGMLSRWGNRTIAVSEDLRQYLAEEYGVSPLRVRVIPNGIDEHRFFPKQDGGVAEQTSADRFRIVFASRLDFDCSAMAYALCRVAKALDPHVCGLDIRICGGGEAYASLKRMAEGVNRSLKKTVLRVMGHVEDLQTQLEQADLVCGVSRVALEACSCGVPILLGGNEGYFGPMYPADFVGCAQTNFCCRGEKEMDDRTLLADLLAVARLSWEQRDTWGCELRACFLARHSLAAVAAETVKVYEEVRHERFHAHGETVLCGYYGFGNMGDDALLRAAILRAKAYAPGQTISAITKNGARDQTDFRIRCVGRAHPLAVLREIAGAKRFVFGGGTLLQDGSSLRSLLYYVGLLEFARRCGVSCELWGNGIEPMRHGLSDKLVARVLKRVDRIECRDFQSVLLARAYVGQDKRSRVIRTADLASGVTPSDAERLAFLQSSVFGTKMPPRYAVVAVRGGETRRERRRLQAWLWTLRRDGVELLFVSLYPKQDDRVTEILCEALGGTVLRGVSEADLVGLMAQSCAVYAMRLHALVFAKAAGVPFVGFGTAEKIKRFCLENQGVYAPHTRCFVPKGNL